MLAGCGKRNFKRRRKVQLLSAFFYCVDGAVAVLKLLLMVKALLQQHLGRLWGGFCFRSSSLPRVYADYFFDVVGCGLCGC